MEECHKYIIIIIELFSIIESFSKYQPPKCTGDEIKNTYYIHELRNAQKNILSPP